MKRYWKRIMSVALTLAMVLPIFMQAGITADAGVSASAMLSGSTKSNDNGDGTGWDGEGLAIGLGKCRYEHYTGEPTDDALFNWVMDYSTRHYVEIEENYYMAAAPASKHGLRGDPIDGKGTCLGTGGDPLGILNAIASGSGNEYIYQAEGGIWAIKPEKVDEVMESLKECNSTLYQEWMSNRYGLGGCPVVIVIESVVHDNRLPYNFTVGAVARYAGADVCGNIDPTNVMDTTGRNGGYGQPSATAKAIYDTHTMERGSVVYNLCTALFGVFITTGNKAAGYPMASNVASWAQTTQTNSTITGCYVIAIGGNPKGTVTGQYLFGSYQWDFDSVDIPENARGHNEDGTAEIAKGQTVSGPFEFGYVNPQSAAWGSWKSWGSAYGGSTVDLELKVYGLATASGVEEYSTDVNTLKSRGGVTNVVPELKTTYTKTGYPFDQFVNDMRNGTVGLPLFDGAATNPAQTNGTATNGMVAATKPAQINGTATNGMVAVAYYTELFVTPHGSGGPQNGKKIQFACDQVHTAVYTPRDDERTYKLTQTAMKGWSQLKDDAIASARFEAQAGTPTTEDMFISMGGNEYLVNMQYALHVDDYKRTYNVNVAPYDNFMYYQDGIVEDYTALNDLKYETTPFFNTKTVKTQEKSTDRPIINMSFEDNKSNAEAQQRLQYRSAYEEFIEKLTDLFANIDENVTGGCYPDKDYDVIIRKGDVTVSDGLLEINELGGSDRDGKKSDAEAKLRQLNNYLKVLKRLYDNDDYKDYRFAASVPKFSLEIPFMFLTDGNYRDYDSEAYGGVVITIAFGADYARYTELSKDYTTTKTHTNNEVSENGSCGHRTLYKASGEAECDGPLCKDAQGSHEHYTLSGSCSTGVGTGEYESDGVTEKTKECGASPTEKKHNPCPKHTHYGHRKAEYTGTVARETHWDVKADCKGYSGKEWNEYWRAYFGGNILLDYEAGPNYIAKESDGDRGKQLYYKSTLEQVYKSVKYMDIVEAHVWRLAGGAASDMTNNQLMCPVTDVKEIMPVIEMTCANLGFTLYNTQPTDQQETFVHDLTTADGIVYEKVWTAVDSEFAEQIQIDESIDEKPDWAANTELQAIGRLANSYNPGSSEEHQFFAEKGMALDTMKITGTGDSLTLTYDIETQGGRSHWSFDGFLKQALANTFYDGTNKAGGAYRNYIIVQSDYLSLGESGDLTMSGMQWISKPMDKFFGNSSPGTAGDDGLTQAILCSNESYEASDLWRYCTNGSPWEPHDLADANVNTQQSHQFAGIKDVKEGSGPRDHTIKNSKPTSHVAQMGKYAEGPDKGEFSDGEMYNEAKNDHNSFVRLDKDPTYRTWDQATIVSNQISDASMGQNANFDTEGKEGSGGSSLNFTGSVIPLAGYIGAEDSVEVDQHIYEPSGGGTTQFKAAQTLAASEFAGASFAMYGASDVARSHLYEIPGGSPVASKRVSCSTGTKNLVENAGLKFPYYRGLNVTRWLPNGQYDGAATALYYDEVLNLYEARPGVVSALDKTLTVLPINGGGTAIDANKSSIVSDLKQAGPFDNILEGTGTGIAAGSNDMLVGVGYGGFSAGTTGVTNSVAIFNPSTAENVYIEDASKELPDGTNAYVSKDDRSGFTERDQRVSETLVESNNGETFISTEELDNKGVVPTEDSYVYTLKERSEYETKAYTEADYFNADNEAQTWTINPSNEGLSISNTGTYRLSLYSNDKDTSVEMKLNSGDTIFTDGNSAYLRRSDDIAPTVTYDDLASAVARYYLLTDSVVDSAKSAMQASLIENSIKRWSNTVETMQYKYNTLNFDWSKGVSWDPTESVTSAADEYNKAVLAYNTAIKSNPIFKYNKGGYSVYSGDAYYELSNLVRSFNELKTTITEASTKYSVPVTLEEPILVEHTDDPNKPPYEVAEMRENGYYVLCNRSGNPIKGKNGVMTFYAPGKYDTPVYGKYVGNTIYSCDVDGKVNTDNVPLGKNVTGWSSAPMVLNIDDEGNVYDRSAITGTTALVRSDYGMYVVVSPTSGQPIEDANGVQTFYSKDRLSVYYGVERDGKMYHCDETGKVLTKNYLLAGSAHNDIPLYLYGNTVSTQNRRGAKRLELTDYGLYILLGFDGQPEANSSGAYTHYEGPGPASRAKYGKLVDGLMMSCTNTGVLHEESVAMQKTTVGWNGVPAALTLDQNMNVIANRVIKDLLCISRMDYGYYAVVNPETLKPIMNNVGVITHYNLNDYSNPIYGRTDETGTLCECDASGTIKTTNKVLKNSVTPTWFNRTAYNKTLRDEESVAESITEAAKLAELKQTISTTLEVLLLGNEMRYDDEMKAYVTDFNNFVTSIRGTFNVPAGADVINLGYADGYDDLRAFMLEVSNAKTTLDTIIANNAVEATTSSVPTVAISPVDGVAATFKGATNFKVKSGAMMDIDLSGLGMSKGSVVSLRIPYDKVYTKPADVTIGCSGLLLDFESLVGNVRNQNGYGYTVYEYWDGSDLVYNIEALQDDIHLGRISFKFNTDAYINQFNGSCVEFKDIWLCDVGSAYSDPAYLGTTIEHESYTAGVNYKGKSSRSRSINKILFDACGVEATVNTTIRSGILYVSKESEHTSKLLLTAEENPHKVPNADWRFYVLGWQTEGGATITSVRDRRLWIDSTVLCWPSASSGTITVGELRKSACLVKFGGRLYLTTKEAGLEHKILESGMKVSKYDNFILDDPDAVRNHVATFNATTFPLTPNCSVDGQNTWMNFTYEYFFGLLDGDPDDAMTTPLFLVDWSKNRQYRFTTKETRKFDWTKEAWEADWTRTKKTSSGKVVVVNGKQTDKSGTYIGLDDEFTIYFDNVGTFPGNTGVRNASGTPNDDLGYGWDTNGTRLLGDRVNKGITTWYGVDAKDESTATGSYTEDGQTVQKATTETTGWIYAKYVTFSHDVYVFADAEGINPTLGSHNADGSMNEPVLVPARTPVYLGQYLPAGGTRNPDAFQSDYCNFGGFLDYGAPEVTKDRYKDPFVYHFWCPLYDGEQPADGFEVTYHSVNINDANVSGNAAFGDNSHLRSGGDAGVGKLGYTGVTPDNQTPGTYGDPTHADNTRSCAIVGRIGALTIADTGDPRYSDSFKTTRISSESVEDFLIYPIVRKVVQYTNTDTTKWAGRDDADELLMGTQRGIVLDPFDVRGRIAQEWAKSDVIARSAERDFSSYNTYVSKAYDTYQTQWFKRSLKKYVRGTADSNTQVFAQLLPLTPDFNKHDTFKATPVKLGYELYCSVESIGDYYGSSNPWTLKNQDESTDDSAETSNANNDYGQQKVQVRPFYGSHNAINGAGDEVPDGPVDVYMRSGDTYVMINSAADGSVSDHPLSEFLQVLYNNYDPNYIETNTGDREDQLDENMKRRLVTDYEANATYEVLKERNKGGGEWKYKSMLTKVAADAGGIGGKDLEPRYTYGCSQILFLRERNMTYVGGKTAALNYKNPIPDSQKTQNAMHAQKWYFGLGLPSSAVFVPHGQEYNDRNVLVEGYIINSIDVVASGNIWTLHYESEVSKLKLDIAGDPVVYEEWNHWKEKYPWLVPVTYYDLKDSSVADLDTQGSH